MTCITLAAPEQRDSPALPLIRKKRTEASDFAQVHFFGTTYFRSNFAEIYRDTAYNPHSFLYQGQGSSSRKSSLIIFVGRSRNRPSLTVCEVVLCRALWPVTCL